MLKFLAPKLPRRTTAFHLIKIQLDNGRSQLAFNDLKQSSETPSQISPYLVINYLPPAPSPPEDPTRPNSSLCPPFHIHLKEDETFHVISGTAKFLLLDQRQQQQQQHQHNSYNDISTTRTDGITSRLAPAKSTVTIPQGQIHTFRNASTSEPLVIEFGFSPPSSAITTTTTTVTSKANAKAKAHLHAKMHRFFRNTQLYRSDCSTHNLPRAMSQVLLFNHHADVALVPLFLLTLHRRFPLFRRSIERIIAPALGRIMNIFGGVVLGKWILGFQASYPEYCRPSESESRSVVDGSQELETVRKSDASRTKHPSDVVCQAWRDHTFDGQSEDWRK